MRAILVCDVVPTTDRRASQIAAVPLVRAWKGANDRRVLRCASGKANTAKSQVKGNFGLWRPASWPKAGIDITLAEMRTGFTVGPTWAMPLKDSSESTDRSGRRAEARLLELP